MKKITYRRKFNLKKRVKRISIYQQNEEKDCTSFVKKSFTYMLSPLDQKEPFEIKTPEIYIVKTFDTKKRIEKFSFQVKGGFFLSHQEFHWKVSFHHVLDIQINWKLNVFSPKKSVILT